jgi:hypothetical protein
MRKKLTFILLTIFISSLHGNPSKMDLRRREVVAAEKMAAALTLMAEAKKERAAAEIRKAQVEEFKLLLARASQEEGEGMSKRVQEAISWHITTMCNRLGGGL